MSDKKLTYEEEDAWLRQVQLGNRKDLPDGRSVEQAREAIHNPKNADDKEKEAYEQAFSALVKLPKPELLDRAKNVGLTEFTDKNKREDIAKAILEQSKKVNETE